MASCRLGTLFTLLTILILQLSEGAYAGKETERSLVFFGVDGWSCHGEGCSDLRSEQKWLIGQDEGDSTWYAPSASKLIRSTCSPHVPCLSAGISQPRTILSISYGARRISPSATGIQSSALAPTDPQRCPSRPKYTRLGAIPAPLRQETLSAKAAI